MMRGRNRNIINKAKEIALAIMAIGIISSCQTATRDNVKPTITVSLPVEAYFIEKIAGDKVDINIMIPQSAGHSDYTPRPSQMMDLSKSEAYFAIGGLDFERTWKERIMSVNKDLKWVDLSEGIELIKNEDHDHEANEEGHVHAIDPHYWLSPKEAKVMAENIYKEIKNLINEREESIDSALNVLETEIESLDRKLTEEKEKGDKAFMIYHPALTYIARDYNMTQMEIEKDGNAPTPQTYMEQIEKAKAKKADVVFVQEGYDIEKAEKASKMLDAKVVMFTPEGYDWKGTMETIINALRTE